MFAGHTSCKSILYSLGDTLIRCLRSQSLSSWCLTVNWWLWVSWLTCCCLPKPEFEAIAKAVKGNVSGGCFSCCVLCLFLNRMLLGVGSGKKLLAQAIEPVWSFPCTLETELLFACALVLTRSYNEDRAAEFLWRLLFLSSSLNACVFLSYVPLLPQLCAEWGLLPGLSLSTAVAVVLQRISIPLLRADAPCEINLDGSAIQHVDISLLLCQTEKQEQKELSPFLGLSRMNLVLHLWPSNQTNSPNLKLVCTSKRITEIPEYVDSG